MTPEREIESKLLLFFSTEDIGNSCLCVSHANTKHIVSINFW
jgi:hypothetical protein